MFNILKSIIHTNEDHQWKWTLFDVGCNKGEMMRYLINSSYFENVIGVDVDESALSEAIEAVKMRFYDIN